MVNWKSPIFFCWLSEQKVVTIIRLEPFIDQLFSESVILASVFRFLVIEIELLILFISLFELFSFFFNFRDKFHVNRVDIEIRISLRRVHQSHTIVQVELVKADTELNFPFLACKDVFIVKLYIFVNLYINIVVLIEALALDSKLDSLLFVLFSGANGKTNLFLTFLVWRFPARTGLVLRGGLGHRIACFARACDSIVACCPWLVGLSTASRYWTLI